MSIDDLRTLDNDTPIQTDLCVIGSGPAGWAIAEELRDSGIRILMVESGGRTTGPETDAFSETENVGQKLFNGRARVLGGTSLLWNGRCIPFDDIDYERRPWVAQSGWPFAAADIAADVDRAAVQLGVGPYYDHGERRPIPEGLHPRPSVDSAKIRSTWWENPPYLNFGHIVTERRSPNLWVLVRATVTHLTTDPNGRRIESVEVADADGRRFTIKAHTVVLCAGGIENPRILLYSNRTAPGGLGNAQGLVGRYLMDHPRDFELIARINPSDADRFRDQFGPYRLDNPRGRHDFSYGFTISPEKQCAEGLLNTAAWPYEVMAEDDPFAGAKRLLRGPRDHPVHDVARILKNPRLLAQAAHLRLVKRQGIRRKVERIGFLVASEQQPNPDSRVQLGQRTDSLGLPVARVDWRIDELEARSQAVLARLIEAEFARLGLPKILLADWVRDDQFSQADFSDGCHPTGTTRMARDPRDGVVDPNCQVHGVDGLYVAGSSVFPTAGHANPTLMIVALAVRLSRHLRERLTDSAVMVRHQPVLASD